MTEAQTLNALEPLLYRVVRAVRAPQPEALSMDAVVTVARRANEAAEKEPTP